MTPCIANPPAGCALDAYAVSETCGRIRATVHAVFDQYNSVKTATIVRAEGGRLQARVRRPRLSLVPTVWRCCYGRFAQRMRLMGRRAAKV